MGHVVRARSKDALSFLGLFYQLPKHIEVRFVLFWSLPRCRYAARVAG
jgi:hypothetical protein